MRVAATISAAEHDDRERAGPANLSIRKKNGSRSVSFKTPLMQHDGKQKVKLRAAMLGLQSQLADGDEAMGRVGPSGFRGRSDGTRKIGKTWLNDNAADWYQITVSGRE